MLSAMRRTPLPVRLRGLRLVPELGRAGPPAPFGETPALVARRSLPRAVVATMRPHQWIKNGLVLAAAGAAGALGRDDVPVRVLLACAVFCLLASGIYAFNDVRDVADDRQHPRKCRPVAAGELSARAAIALGVILMAGGSVLGLRFVAVALAYVGLTITYTLVWRRIPGLGISLSPAALCCVPSLAAWPPGFRSRAGSCSSSAPPPC
jgi:4-hydroxybenzoate polyprenyltransferase